MKTITLYHNPKCSKSRNTLILLEDSGHKVKIIEYLKTPPSIKDLKNILNILELTPKKLMRTTESVYTELGLDNETDEDKLVEAMTEHPILIQRPIVILENKGVIGRPVDNIIRFLETMKDTKENK